MIFNSLFSSLLQFLVILPFFFVAGSKTGKSSFKWPALAFGIFIITSVTTTALSGTVLFEGQQWNWAGKGMSLMIGLCFILVIKPVAPGNFGLTTKIETSNAGPIFLICFLYLVLRVTLYLTTATEPITFHTETILFQASLPGMEEEIVFRGALLTLLNYFFLQRWTMAKISFGWSALLTSLLFGLTHGFFIDDKDSLYFNAFAIGRTAFDGLLFALLTEKTRSLLPGIVFHNLLNLIGNH